MFVETLVDHCQVNRNFGVMLMQELDAFGSTQDTDEFYFSHPPFFQDIDRGNRGTSRGEHGIEDQCDRYSWLDGQLVVVLNGSEGVLVAIQANVLHLGAGHHLPHTVNHT